ncbi:ABC transporter permease [Paenibacillus arenilitoris]|uniref:ABC transporter permease n=1 Tax=Paenibacillus arenilitoris TaxID=2772299 RepID=A0A927CFC5_9BACL|nr:ABC transporter permease [Paenibacillus arenilitoris]MBD2867043.1 ABC transporter permease [Paenibacillus arenilitoris]
MLLENIRIAVSSIYAHQLRSLLTMIGIIIGVASVIMIVAIGQGGEYALKSSFAGSGQNTIDIDFEYAEGTLMSDVGSEPLYTESDVIALSKLPEIKRVIPTVNSSTNAQYLDMTLSVQLVGMTEGYYEVYPQRLLKGRLIDKADLEQGRKVTIIGEDVEKELFVGRDPIGSYIELEGVPFKVIGVVKPMSGGIFSLALKEMIVPRTVWPVLYGRNEISSLTVQALDAASIEAAGQKAVNLLNAMKKDRQRVKGEYYIFNLEQIRESLSTITRIMTGIIGGIAGISLFVGGIGVMNIMLVSVTERTREIGIRKALGATKGEILIQFLIEAVLLTTLGGGIGILIGMGGAELVSLFTRWPSLISWPVIVGGLLFSMVIGIAFGILPANRAAKLQPIEALRYD